MMILYGHGQGSGLQEITDWIKVTVLLNNLLLLVHCQSCFKILCDASSFGMPLRTYDSADCLQTLFGLSTC